MQVSASSAVTVHVLTEEPGALPPDVHGTVINCLTSTLTQQCTTLQAKSPDNFLPGIFADGIVGAAKLCVRTLPGSVKSEPECGRTGSDTATMQSSAVALGGQMDILSSTFPAWDDLITVGFIL